MKTFLNKISFSILLLTSTLSALRAATPPAVGDAAPNFSLSTLEDEQIQLHKITAKSPVVLVVLRGWPGYQCPLCTRQVNEFVPHADEFAAAGGKVIMVYPGPTSDLKAHAREFVQNKNWPKEFIFVTDPDYVFTAAYGLRWEAKNETAYPSTFVIDTAGKVRFAHISKQHGDRVSAAEALKNLTAVTASK